MSHIEVLIGAWMSQKEAICYLSGLELWLASVSQLSRKSGLSRTTLYDVLENMESKWFTQKLKKLGNSYYSMTPPDKLCGLLEKRFTNFQNNLNELMTLSITNKQKQEVELFYWFERIKDEIADAYKHAKIIKSILSNSIEERFINYYFDLVVKRANESHYIIGEKKIVEKLNIGSKWKKLPSSMQDFTHHTEIINNDTVYMISGNGVSLSMIKIKNNQINLTHQRLFDYYWYL